ncbi:polysaccharide deacetylase family protein [Exiguobacterium sp. ZOR0005]|uniref:polysaccharide deacetylase family protein n=1 Tax=Exiguobacterium sp. ZOR0005 TaxID=1339226 RepID=UPI000648EA68|nr:polysaccharide deacetylase family protein [Exiguobacterium sp. ZOR0005]
MRKWLVSSLLLCLFVSLALPVSATEKAVRHDDKQLVYMTFDDGPRPETLLLLDVLKKHQVKATFFILGKQIKGNEDVLKRIVAEGHALGLHSMTHDKKAFYKSPKSAVTEMKHVQQLIFQTTGVKTNVMRVPYGSVPHMTKRHRDAMTTAGFHMWDWNVDSLDWKRKDDPRLLQFDTIQKVRANRARQVASVVLMHDQSTSAASLDYVLRHLKREQYVFTTITDTTPPYNFYNKWNKNTSRK